MKSFFNDNYYTKKDENIEELIEYEKELED